MALGCSDPVSGRIGVDPVDASVSQTEDDAAKVDEDDAAVEDAYRPPEAAADRGAPKTCLEELRALGVPFEEATARGVVDAVRLKGPLNGVTIASEATSNTTKDPMACAFVKSLWAFAHELRAHDVVRLGTLGAYCYRCCCQWSETNFCRGVDDPEPNCGQNGYSNHSFGRALDVRYVYTKDGVRYDVQKDFSESSQSTCGAARAAQTGKSRVLYDLVCDVAAKRIFATILTPNYNEAHRDHFHMDTGKTGEPGNTTVRMLAPTRVNPEGEICDSL